jgi:hypothetical protein
MLLVAACSTQPIVAERTVDAAADYVLERVGAELTALGFTRTEAAPGVLAASTDRAATDWASCPPVLVSDGDDRRVMTTADRRYGEVRATVTPAGGQSTLAVRAAFRASYRNRLRASTFERQCRSTGALEVQLLRAGQG